MEFKNIAEGVVNGHFDLAKFDVDYTVVDGETCVEAVEKGWIERFVDLLKKCFGLYADDVNRVAQILLENLPRNTEDLDDKFKEKIIEVLSDLKEDLCEKTDTKEGYYYYGAAKKIQKVVTQIREQITKFTYSEIAKECLSAQELQEVGQALERDKDLFLTNEQAQAKRTAYALEFSPSRLSSLEVRYPVSVIREVLGSDRYDALVTLRNKLKSGTDAKRTYIGEDLLLARPQFQAIEKECDKKWKSTKQDKLSFLDKNYRKVIIGLVFEELGDLEYLKLDEKHFDKIRKRCEELKNDPTQLNTLLNIRFFKDNYEAYSLQLGKEDLHYLLKTMFVEDFTFMTGVVKDEVVLAELTSGRKKMPELNELLKQKELLADKASYSLLEDCKNAKYQEPYSRIINMIDVLTSCFCPSMSKIIIAQGLSELGLDISANEIKLDPASVKELVLKLHALSFEASAQDQSDRFFDTIAPIFKK